jgi:DNA helicase INO80
MNLVMQLRKVCNHPELFERRPAISPFLFQDIYYYTGYIPIKAGDIKLLSFNSKNPIKFNYPKLAYDDLNKYTYNRELKCKKLFNIYST